MSYHQSLGFALPKSVPPEYVAAAEKIAAENKRKADIAAAAGLIPGRSAPVMSTPSGLPGWVLPVGIGAGALVLFMLWTAR
jgi:NAD/NADP transhydrogenase alpha subunit